MVKCLSCGMSERGNGMKSGITRENFSSGLVFGIGCMVTGWWKYIGMRQREIKCKEESQHPGKKCGNILGRRYWPRAGWSMLGGCIWIRQPWGFLATAIPHRVSHGSDARYRKTDSKLTQTWKKKRLYVQFKWKTWGKNTCPVIDNVKSTWKRYYKYYLALIMEINFMNITQYLRRMTLWW